MDTQTFLDYLKTLPAYRDQVAWVEPLPPREARYGELAEPFPARLQQALTKAGLLPLYSHQAVAINALRSGQNVVVATPAASGKTLCYNLPVLEALLKERGSRALYLYPTKALAQDQLRSLRELAAWGFPELRPGTFDGDTPAAERAEIKRTARVVLTNPDMLHLGILPNHRTWSRFFQGLRYVVLDEAHVYRGVFGSHLAQILRRLRRLCARYGRSPQFVAASATIANPQEHLERLTGVPFQAVTEDGSPYGGKDFVFWSPPLLEAAKGVRRSANSEATFLFGELLKREVRTLTFARTRKVVELIANYVREQLAESHANLASRVRSYRAGYLPEQRRQIEKELFEGKLLGVTATNALELGIDIGDLEATILTGYPGSIASTWQQAGRSGRRGHRSLTFLIGLDNPLDQYYMHHAPDFFGRPHEHALTDPGNLHILKPHLLCAAYEMPLRELEAALFGEAYLKALAALEEAGFLHRQGDRWYLTPGLRYPAEDINIRTSSLEYYTLVDDSQGGEVIETIEAATAFFQVHPGAVYLHQGEPYLVTELDLIARTAHARPVEVNYYTEARELHDLRILKVNQEKTAGGVGVYLGEVEVTTTVIGFKKKRQYTEEVIGEEPLDLPPQSFATVALWFDLPPGSEAKLERADRDLAGGLHAAEHASIGLLPLFALCDRNDLGGLSTPSHPDTGKAQVFIYDACPGGIGIAEKGFVLVKELWQATLKLLEECPCQEGCPSCVQSPKCGNNNEPLDKEAAKILLRDLLGRETLLPPA